MRFIIYLTIIAHIKATTIATEDCENVIEFNGKLHDQIIISKDFDRPYQLSTDRESDLLFFSVSVGNNSEDSFQSVVIDLKNNEYTQISNINDGFASAVDNGTIYLGGSDGLYIYDKISKKAINTNDTSENIWSIFPSDGLYFITYPHLSLYKLRNAELEIDEQFKDENVTQFAIDAMGNKYFYNDTALYLLTSNSTLNEAIMLNDTNVIRGITLNINGEAYFSGEGGVYTVVNKVFKNVLMYKDVYGLAFDKDDNIIYATTKNIVKLRPSNKNCTIATEKNKL